MSITDSMIFKPFAALSAFRSTNFMSSLMASTLMSFNMLSDEYADPKSSISTAMPRACRSRMVSSTTSMLCAIALSVISTCSRRASMLNRSSRSPSTRATSIASISVIDTLTDTGTRLRPSPSQRDSISHTERQMNKSNRVTIDSRSSRGMNSPGDTKPYSG